MEVEVTNWPELIEYTAHLEQIINQLHIITVVLAIVAGFILFLAVWKDFIK